MIIIIEIILILFLLFVLFYFAFPYFKIYTNKYLIKDTVSKLDKTEYKILKDANFNINNKNGSSQNNDKPQKNIIKFDYLIISTYGILVVQEKRFKNLYSNLVGDERKKHWEYTIYGKLLPDRFLIGEISQEKEILNPLQEIEQDILKLSKYLENNKDIEELKQAKYKYIPVVIIIPQIKTVNIYRKDNSISNLIYAPSLSRIIENYEEKVLSPKEVKRLYEKILASNKFKVSVF